MINIRNLITILIVLIIIISCRKTSTSSRPTIVEFQDTNFETLIRESINKPEGDITSDDLETLIKISGPYSDIVNISGIEYCINLEILHIYDNQISDISLLQNLTKLTQLSLANNQVSDVSALNNLTNLEWLSLLNNNVTNISPLNTLIELRSLYLIDNEIINIEALSGLVNLHTLDLSNNQVEDIHPLILNSGIEANDELWLNNNPLNDISLNTYLPQLIARGVTVHN